MKKAKRILGYIVLTSVQLATMYYGLFGGVQWAWNIYRFMIWFLIFISFIVTLSKDIQTSVRKNGRVIPVLIDLPIDLAQIAALAATGHFWMAGFYTFHTMMSNAVYAEPKAIEPAGEEAK